MPSNTTLRRSARLFHHRSLISVSKVFHVDSWSVGRSRILMLLPVPPTVVTWGRCSSHQVRMSRRGLWFGSPIHLLYSSITASM